MSSLISLISLISSSLIAEASVISSKESNVNNNLSLEKRVNLLNTEVIAMQSFQVSILKEPLMDSTLEHSPSDTSSDVKRLTENENLAS